MKITDLDLAECAALIRSAVNSTPPPGSFPFLSYLRGLTTGTGERYTIYQVIEDVKRAQFGEFMWLPLADYHFSIEIEVKEPVGVTAAGKLYLVLRARITPSTDEDRVLQLLKAQAHFQFYPRNSFSFFPAPLLPPPLPSRSSPSPSPSPSPPSPSPSSLLLPSKKRKRRDDDDKEEKDIETMEEDDI